MPAKIPDETIAKILAETDYYSDEDTAARWGISRQSIHRYRKRASTDLELLRIVTEKRKILSEQWATNAIANLNAALIELKRRYTRARTRDDAECIQAIAASLKVVGELKIASDTLNDGSEEESP
ncbi:hypothetical protein F7734_52110 [Scytonema sp. UIC 10036]|uniref:hypothetical protein n=1 Tax=Scytonema sp. UIC 10036 TaxID=2304196 RepID=UPI0012DA65BB|nr:hypothetical protein [Scytonema sp. UIC 10036]MUH00368.1 hypothetical protein [Scytonema sp. UIC 10036]